MARFMRVKYEFQLSLVCGGRRGEHEKKIKKRGSSEALAGTHLEKKSWGLGSSRDCQGRRMQGRDTSLFLFLGFWKLVSRSSSSRDCQGNSKEK